ncbi:MAG: hypothetical protein KF789_05435 [Bdellovibrionaceae bacterium]|nr:hypothetical protein [Pseudobdellovibrionaceae bacterium]
MKDRKRFLIALFVTTCGSSIAQRDPAKTNAQPRLARNQQVCQVQRIDSSFIPLPGSAAAVVQINCKNGKAVIYEDGLIQPRR